MEKGTAHCKLPAVKALMEAGQVRATASAFNGARELGIDDLAGMCAVVLALTPADFCKSMTTHADHRVCQDVYHASVASRIRCRRLSAANTERIGKRCNVALRFDGQLR